MNDPLQQRMLERADADGLPASHPLRVLSQSLEEATIGYFSEPPTHTVAQFVGSWARAHTAWCQYTGETWV